MSTHELKQIAPPRLEEVEGQSSHRNKDDTYLTRMGKRPVLKRNFGLMSMVGFSCTILVTWEGYILGGPAGSVYGYLFVWAGVTATFVVISELVSMAPTSGGQYHWCSMLAPPSAMKLVSYMTGWLTAIGWQATYASAMYLDANMIEALILLTRSDYDAQPWRKTLYAWGISALSAAINIVGGRFLPRFEGTVLIFHILGFFAVLVPLTSMADQKASAEEVFTSFINQGHWPSTALSVFIGLAGPVFAFAGGDAAVHMVEEMTNATTAVPLSLMLSVLINGSMGFGMLIALYFCLGGIETALASPSGVPFFSIFLQATGSISGTAIAGALVMSLSVGSTIAALASASRQFWSFSRDRGIPGWRVWSQVTQRTAIPTYTVILTAVVGCLLNLITMGSKVAFNSLVSMSTSGLYLSYMAAGGLLLYRRCTGGIGDANAVAQHTTINTAGARLVWGPFRVPGLLGIAINIFALVYMAIATFFGFWPPINDVNTQTMNYSVVGTVGTMLLSLLYYYVRARKVYSGPIVEIL
ncbi:amino acid/polyamine transporter I [Aspergillus coremiiformis]|uniref:Amino acid/polyamine transporter I n=1 Tax=Aspergillus coremiiformis TaxID=138285 RepID=A0A5N6Z499_9EURO|nr:amino acid/polyamine transporter I [Aspergillus coremiiformis]